METHPSRGKASWYSYKGGQGNNSSHQLGLPYIVPSIRGNVQNDSARENLAVPANKANIPPKPQFFQMTREGNMILCGTTPSDEVLYCVLSLAQQYSSR